jgi:hypothetical protein
MTPGSVCQEREWPDPAETIGDEAVEFTLRYEGVLPTANGNTRVLEKQRMREDFHFQLKQLWQHDSALTNVKGLQIGELISNRVVPAKPLTEFTRPHYGVFVGRFCVIPIITRHNGLVCHLDIQLLRNGAPGDLVRNGGDIDGRLKVIFDALRMPHNAGELAGSEPAGSANEPLYCVLEDDSLITKLSVEAQRRLLRSGEAKDHVSLHIRVKVLALRMTDETQKYLGA